MGKFSEYLATIKDQTNLLREHLGSNLGVDLSNASIGQCAQLISVNSYLGYQRPSWYPNIDQILTQLEPLTKDGVTYTPAYIMLYQDTRLKSYFYKSYSSSTSQENFNKGFGCDAYIFSDDINKDISNITANSLVLNNGSNYVEHLWNESKDFSYLDSNYKVRYIIAYTTTPTSTITICIDANTEILELVCASLDIKLQAETNMQTNTPNQYWGPQTTIKYLNLYNSTNTNMLIADSWASYTCAYGYGALEEFLMPKNITSFGVGGSSGYWTILYTMYSLKRLVLPENLQTLRNVTIYAPAMQELVLPANLQSPLFFYYQASPNYFKSAGSNYMYISPNLKKLVLPVNATSLGFNNTSVSGLSLQELVIPSSITTFTVTGDTSYGSFLTMIPYVKLFTDFNFNNIYFGYTGSYGYCRGLKRTKTIQWCKDLCGWLKDLTGDTTKNIYVGSANMEIFNNLYCTFDSTTKEITGWYTSADTDRITATEYITQQKNWTIS